ncbi:hypothetical protein K439DRAFT_1387685 [Ramaria rubella]|nr:hypothetical protein K439DRAFT_1387685 [Ramaria rubella]
MIDKEVDHLPNASNVAEVPVATTSVEETNPWSSSADIGQSHDASNGTAPHAQSMRSELVEGSILQPKHVEPQALTPQREPVPDTSVLNEFDPLAEDAMEQAARDAWDNAESHPPPSLDNDLSEETSTVARPIFPLPPLKEAFDALPQEPTPSNPQSAPSTSTTFSSLASLARTLTRSPKRSVTPPLSLPPRSSSLRHAHHASLPSFPSIRTPPAPSTPGRLEPEIQPKQQTENPTSSPSTAASPDAIRINSSPKSGSEGQFDFQKFLDQMKTKGADPIAKYLRSFLSNFAKKTFAVNDQIKIIHDFLDFISDKMRTMDGSPWQNCESQDFDNAIEAMEKLVMNRLYEFTFQPLLPPSQRTTDDLERDHVLRQRISLFGWLREEHLDVPTGTGGDQGGKEIEGFLKFAQQELLKVNHYKAPRDKLICILNCCKVIFGLIRHVKMTEGADSFIPILIFVVLKANPEHLLSNVEYINRFRSPNKLQSEAGYYLSSLMGAVSFIETMDHSSLSNISQEEFERNVEEAIEALPITRTPSPPTTPLGNSRPLTPGTPNIQGTPIPTTPRLRTTASPLAGEEAARPLSLPMPSSSSDVPSDRQNAGPSDSSQLSLTEDTRRFFQRTSDTISKPLVAIGRIFSEVLDETGLSGPQSNKDNERRVGWRDLPGPFAPLSIGEQPTDQAPIPHWSHPDQAHQHDTKQQVPQTPMGEGVYQPAIQTPYKPRIRPAYSNPSANSYLGTSTGSDFSPTTRGQPLTNQPLAFGQSQPYRTPASNTLTAPRQFQTPSPHPSRNPTPTLDFGALQVEIDRAHLAAQDAAHATLIQIFPAVDPEVAEIVLEANDGDLGRSIEALLEISGGAAA